MVPGENANAAAGSGNGVGHGNGGYVTISDQTAGGTRGFAMRLPDNYDPNKPYWLIFGFHWNGGNSAQVDNGGTNGYWWAYYGLQRESNNGAIFVAPDGLNAGWANSGGRDLAFVDDMVKLVEDNYCVDTTHLITSGFSYGGGMSYELACARAKTFRAAVVYEGGQLSGCDGGNDPIALWQTEGLTDTTVSLSLATPIRDRFVKNNGCMSQNAPQPPQPPPYLSPGGHVCTNYTGCSPGHPLRWCVHQSGHTPGPIDGTSDLYNSCATPPKSCSTTCPCTWTPDDVWSWLTSF
jgi:predicted esterase